MVKTALLNSIKNRRKPRVFEGGKSITTPSLTLSIKTLIERSVTGTMSQKTLNGVYYGDKHKELQDWENMEPVEKQQVAQSIARKAAAQADKIVKGTAKLKAEQQLQHEKALQEKAVADFLETQKQKPQL